MALTNIQRYVLKQLKKGQKIDGNMIKMLLDDFEPIATHKKSLYDRYTIKNVPIQSRQMPDGTKINNKLNNDFVGEIIDTKIGYMFGNPIKYAVDKNAYEVEDEYKNHQGFINKFIIRNRMNDADIELGKLVSICGVAGREIYIDKDGNERIANLPAWEVIFLTNSHDEVEYALRFYTELRMVENELKEVIVVEFFDENEITYFVETKDKEGKQIFVFDEEQDVNPKPHIFGVTPIVKVINNEEEMGDTERVNSLIDAYDRTMSDMNSEIEQFRSAYMYFKGEEPDEEMIEKAKQTGGFYVGEDGEIGFITKTINDSAVENHLTRIEQGINRFAKHVNMSDPNYGGGDSSLANQYKLNAMEMKSKILEVKMKSALLRQFKILSNVWLKKGVAIDHLNIFFTFTRNLPANILDEAQTSLMLKGLVSERTRLEQISFVDDVDYELEQMAEDAIRFGQLVENEPSVEDRINLDSIEDEEEV